jgi:uncharacterized protein (DUF1501 family)
MTTQRPISRRQFLYQANCAAVGSLSLFSSLFTLRLTAGAVATTPQSGYKALVCLFLAGGNDSFNMLVPRASEAYAEYSAVRGTIALARDTLLPITTAGQNHAQFGMHPALPQLHRLYQDRRLAFVSNVGTLVEPITVAQYKAKAGQIPVGLFSHSDAQIHWQTMVPQVRGAGPRGWAGRVADCMAQVHVNDSVAMNISVAGNNVWQTGRSSVPYIASTRGSVTLAEYAADPVSQLAIDDLLSQTYKNLYQRTLATTNRKAIDVAMAFDEALSPIELTETFPATPTGNQLAAIARIIAARGPLNAQRQIFFVNRGGWDHHNEVLASQQSLFGELDAALGAFYRELDHHGMADSVALFTASDFGRTLTSNGRGSDHAWGGNQLVIGGGVNGGRIYGQYPTLAVGSQQDVGRGRLLPTTSVDAYGAELATWFGVPSAELATVFPNAGNFFDPRLTPAPLAMF